MSHPERKPPKRPKKPKAPRKKDPSSPGQRLIKAAREARDAARAHARARGGRPPDYKDGYADLAEKFSSMGLTDHDLAVFFEVDRTTIWRWTIDHPEFRNALKTGRDIADQRVERRLYERAIGYTVRGQKVVVAGGKPVVVNFLREYPPDATACIFWLKNRRPDEWREKIEVQHEHMFNFIGMLPSEQEWLEKYASDQEPIVIDQRPPGAPEVED